MSAPPLYSTAPAVVNLECYHGDNWQQVFRLVSDGAPYDLTGCVVEAYARGTTGGLGDLGCTVVGDPSEGRLQLYLAGDTYLEPDLYRYDLQVTDASGSVKTWVRGRLKVGQDVTDGEPY